MNSSQTKWQYLERDPKSSCHQLSIKDRRIKARTLYGYYASEEDPWSIEMIAEQYSLPIEAVKEAIAYVECDPPELKQDYCYQEMMMEARGMNHPGYKYHGKPKPVSPEERARIRRLCYASEST